MLFPRRRRSKRIFFFFYKIVQFPSLFILSHSLFQYYHVSFLFRCLLNMFCIITSDIVRCFFCVLFWVACKVSPSFYNLLLYTLLFLVFIRINITCVSCSCFSNIIFFYFKLFNWFVEVGYFIWFRIRVFPIILQWEFLPLICSIRKHHINRYFLRLHDFFNRHSYRKRGYLSLESIMFFWHSTNT